MTGLDILIVKLYLYKKLIIQMKEKIFTMPVTKIVTMLNSEVQAVIFFHLGAK